MRGFARELLSLGAWVAGYFVARQFAPQLSGIMENWIENDLIRVPVAFVILFVATLVIAGLVINIIGKLISITGLSATDHLFGMVFGIIRGVLIVLIIVSLLKLTPIKDDVWWQGSLFIPHLDLVDNHINRFVDELKDYINLIEPTLAVLPNEE